MILRYRHSSPAFWSLAIGAIVIGVSFTACGGANSTISQPTAQGRIALHRLGAADVIRPNTSNTWTTGTVMPTRAYGAAAAGIGTKAYVLGGANKAGLLNKNQIYDTSTNTWSTGAHM